MLERDVCKLLTRRWDQLGLLYRRVEWISLRGAPDYVVFGTHRLTAGLGAERVMPATVWVEAKGTGKLPEPHQLREHERMRAAGQVVLVIDSQEAIDQWFPL
jgi:hypothetical protein